MIQLNLIAPNQAKDDTTSKPTSDYKNKTPPPAIAESQAKNSDTILKNKSNSLHLAS